MVFNLIPSEKWSPFFQIRNRLYPRTLCPYDPKTLPLTFFSNPPPVMARCEHYEICEREARTGDEKCILHSEDLDKEVADFMRALIEHHDGYGPNFEHMTFPQKANPPFSRYEQRANFRGATFKGVSFKDVKFKEGADFSRATFMSGSELATPSVPAGGTGFATSTVFSKSIFRDEVRFHEAVFEEAVFFQLTTFEGEADFTDAAFEGGALFIGATFEERSLFVRTTFEKEVHFNATFVDNVSFSKATFGVEDVQVSGYGFHINCDFEESVNFSGTTFQKKTAIKDISPKRVDFDKCRVRDSLMLAGSEGYIFNNSKVVLTDLDLQPDSKFQLRNADLSHCRLQDTDVRKIDFTGVKWCEEVSRNELFCRVGLYEEMAEKEKSADVQHEWAEIERLYRGLKKNYEEKGDYPRAGDFHIGEKKARLSNPKTSTPMKGLLWTYGTLSKYGERALPATLWLIGLVLGCGVAYLSMEASTESMTLSSLTSLSDWWKALVLSGEATLFPIQPAGFEEVGPRALNLLQRCFSTILIALLVLALRQRVKR